MTTDEGRHLEGLDEQTERERWEEFHAADRDDLAAILDKHTLIHFYCYCGAGPFFGDHGKEGDDPHRAHVAQMVLESDWLRGVKADVFKRGWIDSAVHHATCHECGVGPLRHEIPDPYRADRVDAEDFADELPAHIEESMKDPEYAAADALHREAEAAWKSWVPSMFADDENMHTAYVSGYKDRAPRVVLPPTQRTTTETTRPTGRSVTF